MCIRFAFVFLAATLITVAQSDTPKGYISGTIEEAGSNTPLAGARIYLNTGGKPAETDAKGHYEVNDLPPGTYKIRAYYKFRGPHAVKSVLLEPGQNLEVNFQLQPTASISGRIVDENGEPVMGAEVYLIAREYRLGALRYVYAEFAKTDDRGQYVLNNVEPGRGFLLLAKDFDRKLSAISDAPADPKLRKKVFEPTWYPDSDSLDGAQVLVFQPGEHREDADIRMRKTASYCAEGVLSAGNGPARLAFSIEEQEPTSGASGEGAMYISPPYGVTGLDGKFRICNLHPGVYRLVAHQIGNGVPLFMGETEVAIGDKDVHNVRAFGLPAVSVSTEVAWDSKPPDQAPSEKLRIWLEPMTRPAFMQELPQLQMNLPIPGEATSRLLADDYSIRLSHIPRDTYVKSITYGGLDGLHQPIHVGKTLGSQLRIVLAHDGGTISAKVADKNGNPVPDSHIALVPADASTDAELAAAVSFGQADQYGQYTSGQLAPGKYFAIATNALLDLSPETIMKLSRARTNAQEVQLQSNASVQVSLVPMDID